MVSFLLVDDQSESGINPVLTLQGEWADRLLLMVCSHAVRQLLRSIFSSHFLRIMTYKLVCEALIIGRSDQSDQNQIRKSRSVSRQKRS